MARALAQESRVLIADEPTAGLDPAHALGLFGTFQKLAAEGRAVIVALHDLTLAARFCHHVVLLVHGRVAASGPVAEVLQPASLSAAFGVTIANGVIADVPIVLAVAPLP
ncbi:MAG: ABC transporter ATP-binding protein [Sphingomonadales bacterium]|nr:ABC transporter ATP-binding protein [Sphingomonadales bacterium]